MDKKTLRRALVTAVWLVALYGVYVLLKQSGLWAQHRWVTVAFSFGIGIVCFTRYWREEGDVIVSVIFLVLGGLQFFLRRAGSTDILAAPLFLGIGLKEAYLLIQSRRTTRAPDIGSQQPKLNHG